MTPTAVTAPEAFTWKASAVPAVRVPAKSALPALVTVRLVELIRLVKVPDMLMAFVAVPDVLVRFNRFVVVPAPFLATSRPLV